jgi:hypothetical protein
LRAIHKKRFKEIWYMGDKVMKYKIKPIKNQNDYEKTIYFYCFVGIILFSI